MYENPEDLALPANQFTLYETSNAGNGAWLQADAITLVNQYKMEAAYYFYNGQAFVSTFEGVDNTQDWPTIVPDTGCLFIPSWSSLGAKASMATGVPNGLFSWGAGLRDQMICLQQLIIPIFNFLAENPT
ncbi:hypothetical protein H4I96_10156 [Botrytis cinerea]